MANGLFNMPSPEAVRQQARSGLFKQAAQIAQAPAGRGFVQQAAQAGGLFGEAIGRAAGGQLPGEVQAQAFQEIQQRIGQEFVNKDLTDPKIQLEMMGKTASEFNNAGMADKAMQVVEIANQIRGSLPASPETALAGRKVQSSKQLAGGLVQIVYDNGDVQTVAPDAAESILIEDAEERGVELQEQRSQARGLGKDSAKQSAKAFTQSRTILTNINNLKDVVKVVGDGANTGPLAKKIPSFKAQSIKLDNIRNRLGLDVVSSVSFGALSDKELETAMSVGLPDKLQGPELIKWANEKIAAQEKLANYYQKAAIFLSKPGNSVGDWIEKQESKQKKKAPKKETQSNTIGRFKIEVE